jgi:16S rRNA (cytosine967-C5)-methyltransferase
LLKEAWTLAIETLSWMEMRRLSERHALSKTEKQLGINEPDALKLAHLLVFETIRRRNFIDKFVNSVTKPHMIAEYNLGVQSFLRLYVYQTRVAKAWRRIDIDEAKNLARLARSILGWKNLQEIEPFLGRLLTQNQESILEGLGDEERLGFLTFHPIWFVKYCFKLFGRRGAIALLEADLHSPPSYIRLNTLKASESEILGKLNAEGVTIQKVEKLRHTYMVLPGSQSPAATASLREGLLYVQDKASCFAVEVVDPKPGMSVMDVCAAPGAKTTHLAQLMHNRGTIHSVDYSRSRMAVWKREVARMGVQIAEPVIADARDRLPLRIEADLVVLDPPCTGTGMFGKSPSAKWRLTPRSADRMAEIQWDMINNCVGSVKPGGALVYSTCSTTVEENEMIIERFLKLHLDFSLAEMAPQIGLPGLRGLEKCRRLYPHMHQSNGFFIAKLLKSSE